MTNCGLSTQKPSFILSTTAFSLSSKLQRFPVSKCSPDCPQDGSALTRYISNALTLPL